MSCRAAALIALSVSFAPVRSAQAQGPAPLDPGEIVAEARPTLPTVFEGVVLEPDGAPAAGVLVVSSAGGKAVTELDGSYRLEVRVPLDAHLVQVTAVAEGVNHAASATVELVAAARNLSVPPLALTVGAGCHPRWLPTFGIQPGTDGFGSVIRALAVFDDGSGPALYAAGSFGSAGGVPADDIARWDGSRWSALESGMNGEVRALLVFDDGSGPALYAAGAFTSAGGVDAKSIAKWNGSSWSALGAGMESGARVDALAVFDDGSGPALYAGGNFTHVAGRQALRVARWDGSAWSALGGPQQGPNAEVHSLAAFDDGGGPALYVGGDFNNVNGMLEFGIARWNGTSWSSLAGGVRASGFASVYSLAVYDDGSGPALVAGGEFTVAGGVSANRVARWDGTGWSALGGGTDGTVQALIAFDDGGGPALYAAGAFMAAGGVPANRLARWDGASWSPLAGGTDADAFALAVFDDGSGAALHAAGSFRSAGDLGASRIAKWDGASWSTLGSGLDWYVVALTVFDDGNGPALYAGGVFRSARGATLSRIARWDGASWAPLGGGMDGAVLALSVFDDGGGPALIAGGTFATAGGVAASYVAKWDGSSWAPLGGGLSGGSTIFGVHALEVFDDGRGPALYAGGDFAAAGGVPAKNVARWDGASWSPLSSGTRGGPTFGAVLALEVFDDGSGRALYAGGHFRYAGDVLVNHVARWDGASWSPLSSGTSGGAVAALTVFDDGRGPALFAGGRFELAGGVAVHSVAKWDGASWSALGAGMGGVNALEVFDDGRGAALYAGGPFTTAGGLAANCIARWDGASWSALGAGMIEYSAVHAFAVFDDGHGPDLYAGGYFPVELDSGDAYLARWGCPFPVTIRSKVR